MKLYVPKISMRLHVCLFILVHGLVVANVACVSSSNAPQIDPSRSAITRTALAAEYIKSNQLDAAKRSLEQALTADPKSPEAHLMMAVLLQTEGSSQNLKQAEIFFKKAIRLKNDFPQANNNYGVFLLEQKRFVEAQQQLEIAANALGYAGRAQALENLGRVNLQLNQHEQAKSAFLRSLQADDGAVIARLELAELYLKEGKLTDATQYFENYMQRVGRNKLGARSLWLGARIANALGDRVGFDQFAGELKRRFPSSEESLYAEQIIQFRQP